MAMPGGALSQAVPARRSGDRPEASATTAQPDLLEFPEHPHKGGAETNDDAQKQQSIGGSCEHGEHPSKEANGVNSEQAEIIATWACYTKVAHPVPGRAGFIFDRLPSPRRGRLTGAVRSPPLRRSLRRDVS